jgi:WD40 repeat protein
MSSSKRIKLSKLKSVYTCCHCNKILKNPIRLPCNISICFEHTKSQTNNVFNCKSCLKEHIIPQIGFVQDVDLKRQIDSDQHLTDSEKEHKHSLNALFDETCELFAEFDLKFNEFEYFNHEHFAELERQIEIRRENLKIQIDEISEEMIKLVKEKKQKFAENAQNIKIIGLKEIIEQQRNESLEKFRCLDLSIQAMCDLEVKQQNYLKELQEKLQKFVNIKTEVEKFAFASTGDLKHVYFGRIIEKLDYFVKINDFNVCEIWSIETNTQVKKVSLKDSEKQFEILAYEVIEKSNLLTLCSDNIFRVFDLKSGECLRTFGNSKLKSENSNLIRNKELVILVNQRGINFYNIERGCLVKHLKVKKMKDLEPIAVLDNGNVLCVLDGFDENRVQLIEFESGNVIKSYNADTISVKLLSNNLFACGTTGGVKIFDIETGECTKVLSMRYGEAWDLELSKDGTKLISSCYSFHSNTSIINVWDILNNYAMIKSLKCHDTVYKIKMYTNDKLAILEYGSMNIWNLELDECTNILSELGDLASSNNNFDNFDFCSFF